MSIKKGLIINTSINLLGYIYLLVVGFISIRLMLQNLGRDLLGAYLLMTSVVPLSSVFDFGISSAVVRYLSLATATKEEKSKVWQTSFYLFILMSIFLAIIVFAILVIFFPQIQALQIVPASQLSGVILLIGITVFINQLNTHFLCLPQANQRFDVFNSKTFLVGTGNTIVTAIMTGYTHDFATIFAIQLVLNIVTLVYMIFYSLRSIGTKEYLPRYDHDTAKKLMSFGLRGFIGSLSGQAEMQFSSFALGSLASAQAITFFSIPKNIVSKAAALVSQVSQAIFPFSASLLEKGRVRNLRKLVYLMQIAILFFGVFGVFLTYLFGEAFLLWWLKDAVVVASAYPVLKVLSYYLALLSLTPIATVIIQSINKPQVPSFFALLTFVIEAIAMIVLIPMFGALGAAYATLLSVSITVPSFSIVAWYLFEKEIKKIQFPDQIPAPVNPSF